MQNQQPPTEPVDRASARRVRQTTKRRTVAELSHLERRLIPESYEMRGPGSDARIADEYRAQRSDVLSLVVHKLTRQVRRLEAWRAMGCTEPVPRKPVGSAELEIVRPRRSA